MAVLWKNGKAQNLTEGKGSETAGAHAVAISGTDVYVAGFERKTNGAIVAILWKNGKAQELTNDSSNSNDARAYTIAISGKDVYVAGVRNGNAIIWKNGKALTLVDNKAASIYDLFIK